jgi:hypothetical protein
MADTSRMTSNPIELMTSVVENSRRYGVPVFNIMYDPDTPTPRSMLSIGPPKQAEKPMTGANACECHEWERRGCVDQLTATEIFATRSARELPIAKIVRPMIAFDSPKINPKV